MLTAFTDGACSGNGKENAVGGYGVAIWDENDELVYCNSEITKGTTNNREELKAIADAINFANGMDITIHSDSAYSINTLSNWMFSWAKKGWIKSDKKIPENLDIIQPLYQKLSFSSNVQFVKVKGHNGLLENEYVDALATGDEKRASKILNQIKNRKLD